MTQAFIGSRKRGRSLGEDENRDFTPLSKRINNLHINTNGSYNDSNKASLKQNIVAEHPQHTCNGVYWSGVATGNEGGGSNHQSSHGLVQVNGSTLQTSVEPSTSGIPMMGVAVRHDQLQCPDPMPVYNPDLSIGENPFYYESNKLLFHLYRERLQRSSHTQY